MTTRADRPLTGPYWAAVDDHRLVRPRCDACGRSHFSPQVVCPWCQSPDWTWTPSSGTGTVVSHTTIHRAPDPSFTAPYVVADVEMSEGWRLLSWIVGCRPDEVHIDMPVEVRFVPGADGEALPAFAPRAQAEPREAGSGRET